MPPLAGALAVIASGGRVLEAALVLTLLAVFYAQLLAPLVDAVRRRSLVGRSRRPMPLAGAIAIVYAVIFAAGALAWVAVQSSAHRWVQEAPAAIATVIADVKRTASPERLDSLSLPPTLKRLAGRATRRLFESAERDVRSTIHDLARARRYVWSLALVPVAAFLLLNKAQGFRRSALRPLPHSHLRWRAEEFVRDVNSALAGYFRAQLAAGLVVAGICTVGFSAIGVRYAVPLGAAAGVLELIPVVGPLAVMLAAVGQAPQAPLVVLMFLAALRVVQDYAIYPRLIRRDMHLPSAVVILAVWIGAAWKGAAGIVVAIPAAGVLAVSHRHWRDYRAIERLVRAAGTDRSPS